MAGARSQTALDGMTINNPGSNFALRGSGAKAWFGWPNDEKLESLCASWFDAPDLKAQKAIAEQVQLQALQTVPYVPLGEIFQPNSVPLEHPGPREWAVRAILERAPE